jgi:hypothetical protein
MSGYVKAKTEGRNILESIRYRNLAPLYCDEPMRICGSMKKSFVDGELYDVWIEGPTGGVAVKGTVRTIVRQPLRGDTDTTKRPPASATKSVTHERPSGPFACNIATPVRKIATSTGQLIPATSLDRLKGSRHVEILSNTTNQTASPVVEDRQTLDTAEDTSASVRRSGRLVGSVAPNSKPRNRKQQESKTRGTDAVVSSKLRLSKFTVPPVPSPLTGGQQSSTLEDASQPTLEPLSKVSYQELPLANNRKRSTKVEPTRTESSYIRRIEAPPSHMVRTVSYRTRQLLSRIARPRRHTVVTPSTGPVVRKYAGKPYIYDPTDLVNRYSRYKARGVRKIAKVLIGRRRSRMSIDSRLPVWSRL